MHLSLTPKDVRDHNPGMSDDEASRFLQHNMEFFRDAVWELLQDLVPAQLSGWQVDDAGPPVREVLIRHPGKTSYHDNTLWVPMRGIPKRAGVWLKPGQAIAVVDLPANVEKHPADSGNKGSAGHSGFFDSPAPCAGDTLGDAY